MFYSADKTEDLSPGGSLSDRSEGLPHRGKGGARIQRSFCNKDQVVGTSEGDCSLKKTRHPKLRNLALFYVWKRQESGLTEIIPLLCTAAIWGQYPALSHLESPQGAPLEGGCSS